jgi:prepilin-type N-terminal cleavage/methylation domain-containing protein
MRSEKGFTLIEVLISLAVFGIIAVGLLIGLTTSSEALIVNDTHETAKNLAETQMESIQNQLYDGTNNAPVYAVLSDLPPGYQINLTNTRVNKGNGTNSDTGIQQITITVTQGIKTAFTLVDYKLDPAYRK